ncbi:DNA-binding HxlR family transcriptional regulator [Burkholderia ambifaria]|nr:helix-turn-helix domain-containing protein [Burkholderia ambifaria]MDR6500009.1 DNA-binding HxlR family transcriptional regulator [Burkholderia ambifaria]
MRKVNGPTALNERTLESVCVLNAVLSTMSRRWKMQILFFVHHGSTSFSALKALLPGISDQVLDVRLGELVSEGLLEKYEDAAHRPAYRSTSSASSLLALMQGLCDWGKCNLQPRA